MKNKIHQILVQGRLGKIENNHRYFPTIREITQEILKEIEKEYVPIEKYLELEEKNG